MKQPRKRKHLDPNTILLIRQIIVGVLIFTFIGLLLSTVWFGSRIDAMTITQVEVTGGQSIPQEEIETIAKRQLEGTYIGIVPRAFSPLYPQQDILNEALQIERLKTITIERDGGTKLKIHYDEFIPDSLWCNDDDTECYFIDQDGFAFTKAPELKGGIFLRLESIGVEPSRVRAYSKEEYDGVKRFVTLFRERNWRVSRVEIDAAKDAFLSVIGGGELKISLLDNPESVIDNFVTVLGSENFSHIVPGNFEYIDLRFGNKVFVNETGPELEETASSTEEVIE